MSDVRLKVCGVKSSAEATQLVSAGIDIVGLNFVEISSRFISIETAEDIQNTLKGSGIQSVALFAGRPLADVNEYIRRLSIDYVQLHGNEPADYARGVNAPVIRAIPVEPDNTPSQLLEFIDSFPAAYFVLDRHQQGQGSLVDIGLAKQIIMAKPDKIFLAGGLSSENLQDVLSEIRPYGIDIASGVRDEQDNLDISKVMQCLKIIHNL